MTTGVENKRSWLARWFAVIRNHRFDILLLALVLLMVAAPTVYAVWPTRHPLLAHVIMLLVFGATLLSAVLAACQSRRTVIFALSLAVPGYGLDAMGLLLEHDGLAAFGHVFETAFMAYTIVVILRFIFAGDRVSLNVIWASLCVYLLLGVLWANVYSLWDIIEPGASFHFSFVDGDQRELMRLGGRQSVYPLYYSFITMTTLGYGDIVPVTGATRMMAAAEALTGQLYLAVLVARLVGMHIAQSMAKRMEPPPGDLS